MFPENVKNNLLKPSKYDLGEDYEVLLKSCENWQGEFQGVLNCTIKQLMSSKNMAKIVELYNNHLDAHSGFKTFLSDLISIGYSDFLIPYSAIFHEIPSGSETFYHSNFGAASNFPLYTKSILTQISGSESSDSSALGDTSSDWLFNSEVI